MPNVNLSPLDAQQAALNRRRALALALQQQSMEPIAAPPVRGAQISPVEGIAKLAQALVGNLSNRRLDKEQSALSDQQQQQRESQALALSNTVTPQPQGLTAPMAQPQEAQIPGVNAVTAQSAPPMPTTLPVGPGQVQGREQAVSALARALTSQDPMMAESGRMLLQNQLTGNTQQRDQAAEMARLLAGQSFTAGQKQLDRSFEGQQNAQSRGLTQQQIDLQREALGQKETKLLTPEEEAQQLRLHPPTPPAAKNIDPLSKEGIEATIKLRQAEARLKPDSDMSAEQVDALVAAAKINPDSLKKLSPKDYATVAARLQQTGGTAPDKMQVMKENMSAMALDSAKWLRDNFQPTAVGAKGLSSGFGLASKPAPGTKARDFTDKFETFKNQIVLPNLDMLKGLGRVTDREFQALTSSINAIDRSMSEDQFKTELSKIIGTFENMKSGTPAATELPGGITLDDIAKEKARRAGKK